MAKKPPVGRDDTSKYVCQNKKVDYTISIKDLNWTEKQQQFIQLVQDKRTKAVFCKGPSGTSKTCLAVYTCLHLLNNKKVDSIHYIRPAVESAANPLGFLPGAAADKIGPYAIPFRDKCSELLSDGDVKRLGDDNRLHTQAINFLRGQHLAVKGIIVDEAQNATMRDLVTILTRIGEHSKLLILGDPRQSDVFQNKTSDFQTMYDIFDDQESRDQGVFTFEFTHDDIVRSEFVRFVVTKLELNNRAPII